MNDHIFALPPRLPFRPEEVPLPEDVVQHLLPTKSILNGANRNLCAFEGGSLLSTAERLRSSGFWLVRQCLLLSHFLYVDSLSWPKSMCIILLIVIDHYLIDQDPEQV